jgi:PAT family beta-lactamase induction signal transducer AmpG
MTEPLSNRTKLTWVAILYFAEGFPFGLLLDAFPVYFRMHGVSLAEIGLLSLIRLPWTLKFLWAPAVDLWGKRRSWIVACQSFLAVSLIVFLALRPEQGSHTLWILLIALAMFSATQDIAIDAYSIELLNEEEMGPANGVRVSAYRVALICSGGVFVALAGFIGWDSAFLAAAILLAISALLSSRAPQPLRVQPEQESWTVALRRVVIGPFRAFWQRPGFIAVMLFILAFKLGDVALGPMVRPFWVDRHFTPVQIGAIPGTIGVVSSISGALLGGQLTKTWGIFRALWILGIAQAASNLAYAAAAALPPSDALMYGASIVESFCGGLGTAPFLAFLMSVCDKEQAATQYALLSALFALPGPFTGAVSGWATQHFGYATYFTVTFFLAWPAFALLPWVKEWLGEEKEQQEAHAASSAGS